MQCSKPAAANGAIGGTIVTTRSMVVRALKHIHTPTQTSALHIMPSVSAGTNASAALLLAVLSATSPTAPLPKVYWVVRSVSAAVAMVPMQLPVKATTQFSSTARVVTLPLAQAMTSSVLPVNSS